MREPEQLHIDNLDKLTIIDGNLYWDGRRLKTESVQHVVFSFWQWVTGAAIAFGAIATPAITYMAELDAICSMSSGKAPFCQYSSQMRDNP